MDSSRKVEHTTFMASSIILAILGTHVSRMTPSCNPDNTKHEKNLLLISSCNFNHVLLTTPDKSYQKVGSITVSDGEIL